MIDVKRLEHDPDYWDEVGAPEEATHFIVDNDDMLGDQPWFYTERDDRYIRCGDTCFWRKSDIHPGSHIIIPRPTRKQWSGPEDGLPPIGSECTIEDNGRLQYGGDHAGRPMEVVAHVEDCAVLRLDWGLGCFDLTALRPLKSEKERVVEAFMGKWKGSNIGALERWARKEFLERMYDAGFLKMPEATDGN